MSPTLAALVLLGALVFPGCTAGGPNPDGDGDMNSNGPDPVDSKVVEIGYTDLDSEVYAALGEGATMPLFTAFQGGSHVYVTIRARGFPMDAGDATDLSLEEIIRVVATDEIIHQFSQVVSFSAIDADTLEVASRFMFLNATPDELDGATVRVELHIAAIGVDSSKDFAQSVLLQLQ
ncbi:MAG: hypothetical protein H6817_09950 [Phycisphaerales bacterium]|nr:hypothetical protein [Phycisphaerales bacterium]